MDEMLTNIQEVIDVLPNPHESDDDGHIDSHAAMSNLFQQLHDLLNQHIEDNNISFFNIREKSNVSDLLSAAHSKEINDLKKVLLNLTDLVDAVNDKLNEHIAESKVSKLENVSDIATTPGAVVWSGLANNVTINPKSMAFYSANNHYFSIDRFGRQVTVKINFDKIKDEGSVKYDLDLIIS